MSEWTERRGLTLRLHASGRVARYARLTLVERRVLVGSIFNVREARAEVRETDGELDPSGPARPLPQTLGGGRLLSWRPLNRRDAEILMGKRVHTLERLGYSVLHASEQERDPRAWLHDLVHRQLGSSIPEPRAAPPRRPVDELVTPTDAATPSPRTSVGPGGGAELGAKVGAEVGAGSTTRPAPGSRPGESRAAERRPPEPSRPADARVAEAGPVASRPGDEPTEALPDGARLERVLASFDGDPEQLETSLAEALGLSADELTHPSPHTLRSVDAAALGHVLAELFESALPRLREVARRWLTIPATAYELDMELVERWLREGRDPARILAPRLPDEGLAMCGPQSLSRLARASRSPRVRQSANRWTQKTQRGAPG